MAIIASSSFPEVGLHCNSYVQLKIPIILQQFFGNITFSQIITTFAKGLAVMKKVFQIVVMLLWSVVGFAQNGLQGAWVLSQSIFGIKVANTMTFSSDSQGIVTNEYTVTVDISRMGVKISGKTEMSERGSFSFDGSTLSINWDLNSVVTTSQGIEATRKGEVIPEAAEQFQSLFDEIADAMCSAEMANDSFTDVTIKADKLSLDGDKYKRVK